MRGGVTLRLPAARRPLLNPVRSRGCCPVPADLVKRSAFDDEDRPVEGLGRLSQTRGHPKKKSVIERKKTDKGPSLVHCTRILDRGRSIANPSSESSQHDRSIQSQASASVVEKGRSSWSKGTSLTDTQGKAGACGSHARRRRHRAQQAQKGANATPNNSSLADDSSAAKGSPRGMFRQRPHPARLTQAPPNPG